MKIELNEYFENYTDILSVVSESAESNEKPQKFLEGVWCQSEVFNANRRWYQNSEMVAEMERFNSSMIPKRKALGELDHSSDNAVQLHRVSHIFETDLYMDGNNLCGRSKVLDTTYGKTLSILIDEKIPFGVSSKGLGELSEITKKGVNGKLVSNFQLTSVGDVVYNQSAPDAIPNVIIEMIMSNDVRVSNIFGESLIHDTRQKIKSISIFELDRVKKQLINNIMQTNV